MVWLGTIILISPLTEEFPLYEKSEGGGGYGDKHEATRTMWSKFTTHYLLLFGNMVTLKAI
jgi:hypothetical protein